MATETISTTTDTEVRLGLAGQDIYSLVVTGTGIIVSPGNGVQDYGIPSGYGTGDSVTNHGIIQAASVGVQLDHGENGLNNTGSIYGGTFGAWLMSDTAVNSGHISGKTTGIFLSHSDLVNTGVVSGVTVAINSGNAWVNNEAGGTISATDIGILSSGGTVSNAGFVYGGVSGTYLGVIWDSAGSTFSNSGTVSGREAGVVINNTGSFINTGVVDRASYGLYVYNTMGGSINITDSGTISGSKYAIFGVGSFGLTLTTGAVIDGAIKDATGNGELTLEGQGSLSGLSDFSNIYFLPGATWTLEGSTSALASDGPFWGFSPGDTIKVDGFTVQSDTFVADDGLILSNGTSTETLRIAGELPTYRFDVVQSGSAVLVSETAPCFCAGTRLATSRGNIAVENLKTGDLVRTAGNGYRPIRWIGRRSYNGRFVAGNRDVMPVCIRRHALGFNVPSRDLWVSPDHSLNEGGVLVFAWRFINGVSIIQAETVERIDYLHIELDSHDIVFAHNAPVETFLDADCRNRFATAIGEPGLATTPCRPRVKDGYYLARLKERVDRRAGIKPVTIAPGPLRGNVDEAGPHLAGWAQDISSPERPVELEVLRNGRVLMRLLANGYREDLRAAGLGSGCHAFDIPLPPPHAGELTLRRVTDGAVLGIVMAAAA